MLLNFLVVTLACLSAARADWVCPTVEEMGPCDCVESFGWIRCNGENITSADQIREVLDRISPIIGQDIIFPELFIIDTPLKEIPAGIVQSMKFERIRINQNPNLVYISPDAFIGTVDTIAEVEMHFNNVDQDESTVGWIFEFLSVFTNAWRFDLHDCGITTVPDNALGYLPNLRNLEINLNPVKYVGNFAFAQLPSVYRLYIANDAELTPDSIAPNAFRNLSNDPELYVSLSWNENLEYLPEESIKPALESSSRFGVGGMYCQPWTCEPGMRFACDERMDWFCALPRSDREKLEDYYCKDSPYDDIFKYCAALALNATATL